MRNAAAGAYVLADVTIDLPGAFVLILGPAGLALVLAAVVRIVRVRRRDRARGRDGHDNGND